MSVSSTLLNAAAKQVELAFQAVIAVPSTNDELAQIAWELDEIRLRLEGKVESSRVEPRQQQLELGE